MRDARSRCGENARPGTKGTPSREAVVERTSESTAAGKLAQKNTPPVDALYVPPVGMWSCIAAAITSRGWEYSARISAMRALSNARSETSSEKMYREIRVTRAPRAESCGNPCPQLQRPLGRRILERCRTIAYRRGALAVRARCKRVF